MLNYRKYGRHKPVFGAVPQPGHALRRGLVGHWLMNEGSGSTMYDCSGYRNHGAITTPNWTGGPFGPRFQFASSNVNCGAGTVLNITADLSISCWLSTTTAGTTTLVIQKYNSAGSFEGFGLRVSDAGYIGFWSNGVGGWSEDVGPGTINDGLLHHVAVTCAVTGSGGQFYKDGKPTDTFTYTAPTTHSAEIFYIGSTEGSSEQFAGPIDDVRVYNRRLTDDEIRLLTISPFADFAIPSWTLEAAFVATVATNPARMTLPTYPVKRASNW